MDTSEGQKFSRQGSGAELLTAPSRGQLRRAAAAGELINAEYEKTRDFVERASEADLADKKLEIQSLNHLYSEASALSEDFFGEGVHGLSEEHEDRITELERLSREIADVADAIRAGDSEGAPDATGEDPQFNDLFVAAGFKDDFSVPPVAPNSPEVPGAVPAMPRSADQREHRLVDFYRRWQAGDPSLFLDMWGKELGTIKRDILVMLRAAGYDEAAITTINTELIKPWLDKVSDKKRQRNQGVGWGDLRDEILHTVSGLLAGKEPDLSLLAPQEAAVSQQTYADTEPATPETLPDAVETMPDLDKELEQAQFQFLALRDGIGAQPKFAIQRELGDRILAALSNITERDETIVLRLKKKYLKTLEELNQLLQNELAAQPSDGVVVTADTGNDSDAFVPPNLPVENVVPVSPDAEVEATPPHDESAVPPAPPEAVVSPTEPPVLTEVAERGYKEANHERAEARKAFVSARDAYYTALREFYQGKVDANGEAVKEKEQAGRRLAYQAREFFGAAGELPPRLQELKETHDLLQMEYALKLNGALLARAESRDDTREYRSLADARTRAAFANRFIVQTALETRGAKHDTKPPSEFVRAVKGYMAYVKNRKWAIRAGLLVGYAGIGAITGGVGAAVVAGGRFVAGTVAGAAGGAAGGALGMKAFQSGVEKARTNLDETLANQTDNLSFANFATAQEEYSQAYGTLRRKEAVQGVAGIAGAVLGGMAAGRAASEVVSDVWNAIATDPIIEMKAVTVPRYAPNGEPLPALSVEGISLRGAHVTDLATGDIEVTDVVIPKVMSEIRLHIKDLLEAHPNMSQGKLEVEVFSRLEAKYGEQGWWQKADIKSLDIGTITLQEVPENQLILDDGSSVQSSEPSQTETLPAPVPTAAPQPEVLAPVTETPAEVVEAPAPTEAVTPSVEAAVQVEHTVVEGDTLMKIMATEYADVLKDVAPADRDRVLTELFDRVRTDATLRESVGLKSGDVDRIFVGEELKLDTLGAELKSLLEGESVRPRTGALSVTMEGGVEDVPIQVNNSPIDAAYIDKGAINGYMERTNFDTQTHERVGQPVPVKPGLEVYQPPRPEVGFVAKGNYFDSPQYRSFLIENNVPPELVEDATKKFAVEFEGRTYSWLNELLQKFDSPYEELRGITLQELDALRKEAGSSEEALRVLLAKQAAAEAAERGVAVGDVPKTFNVSTVRAWDSLIDAIRRTEGFAYNENTTVEDLVKRYVGEQMIQNNYNASFGVRGK